ncbi:MAG: hypothetical protein RL755_22 [Pseudomonadota bacterium]|jgi:hypothetical protein
MFFGVLAMCRTPVAIIENGTLWKRKHGDFTHLVYEVTSISEYQVSYRVKDDVARDISVTLYKEQFLKIFRELTPDEILENCPIV